MFLSRTIGKSDVTGRNDNRRSTQENLRVRVAARELQADRRIVHLKERITPRRVRTLGVGISVGEGVARTDSQPDRGVFILFSFRRNSRKVKRI